MIAFAHPMRGLELPINLDLLHASPNWSSTEGKHLIFPNWQPNLRLLFLFRSTISSAGKHIALQIMLKFDNIFYMKTCDFQAEATSKNDFSETH